MLLLFALIFAPKSLQAQDSGVEVAGLLQRLLALSAALHQNNYTIVHIEVDKLEKGQSYAVTRALHSSNRYKIVGVGGVGIKDLDIYLHDQNGNLIDKDISRDNLPEVDVAPRWSGDFRIRINLYELEDEYSSEYEYFFCFIIAFKRH